jgi:O-acetyl-ADP-ribose deacetylase (regulator of RNase III)
MSLKCVKGDITTIEVDAVVNAANSSLLGGGGVDGAIHRKAGKALLEACVAIRDRQGGCATGQAVITTAGNLPATYVIHTVGPVWQGGDRGEDELLGHCYRNSLQLALDHGVRTIAFPNISTGIYRFPKERAARIAVQTTASFEGLASFSAVTFVCFDDENFDVYRSLLGGD